MAISGCDRRPLEDELQAKVTIPIKIYWDVAGISPKNATILFYDKSGDLYGEWKSASQPGYAEGSMELIPGTYTAVAFNELRDQIDYVHMQGWEKLETLEAFVTQSQQILYPFSSQVEKETYVHQPGILAARLKTFTITPDMLGKTAFTSTDSGYYALSDLHPTRKTAQANVTIHVKGLNNARMPAITQLRHMASGYFFATDRNSLTPVTTQFTINNRKYDVGSNTDGSISTSATTFGVLGEWHHTGDTPDASFFLDIAFMLADAGQTIVEYSTDITHIMDIIVNENNAVTININLGIGPLPEIKPVGGDSGFETDLVQWDKVVIPLKAQ